MRPIEKKITESMRKLQSGVFGNTAITVVSDPRDNNPHTVSVVLHASTIATFNVHADRRVRNLRVNLSNWNTRITRSRIDPVIRYAAQANGLTANQYPKGLGVSSRADVIRIHDKRGDTVIEPDGWFSVEVTQ